jgi:hypothetical protein
MWLCCRCSHGKTLAIAIAIARFVDAPLLQRGHGDAIARGLVSRRQTGRIRFLIEWCGGS